jgi:hypothetical protein
MSVSRRTSAGLCHQIACSCERITHRNFLRAARDPVRDGSIQADACEEQRNNPEETGSAATIRSRSSA